MFSSVQPKDFEISSPPADGISKLSFSPTADFLAASSFDGQTRIWQIEPSGTSIPKAAISHDAPALCVAWAKDGSKLVSGSADKTCKLMDLNTGATSQVALHDAPIKECKFVDINNSPMLVTGSWDKTVRYWDLRSPNPAFSCTLNERVYAMDVVFPLMVVGTADRNIVVYNLNNPSQPFKNIVSPLKYQTRVVSCFPSATGFAIGSIEGRVGIHNIDDKDTHLNFTFKCHRDEKQNVYAVNDISFHPKHGTFSTCGSDGAFHFWDKESKQRLKMFNSVGTPIVASSFNRLGNIFGYAVSYDWGKGHEGNTKPGSQIFLHAVKDEDVKPKPAKAKSR